MGAYSVCLHIPSSVRKLGPNFGYIWGERIEIHLVEGVTTVYELTLRAEPD